MLEMFHPGTVQNNQASLYPVANRCIPTPLTHIDSDGHNNQVLASSHHLAYNIADKIYTDPAYSQTQTPHYSI